MYLNLNDRRDRNCPSGTQCSSASVSSSTLSSSLSSTTSTPSPTAQNAGTVASTTSASPSETTTVVVDTPNPAPKGPIIAGVICGIVVLAIFTAMLWFFCRRRKQLDLLGRSTPLVGNNGSNGCEKFAMDHSPDEEAQRHSGGVFAPFGGYHKTPSVEARESSDRSLNRSLDIATVEHTVNHTDADADAPIPDPEKSSLVPPPDHEHPAYHQLPGQAPDVPVYNQSQHSAHPASRSASTRQPAYNTLPSQAPKRSRSDAQPGPAYEPLPSQSPPEPTYDPKQPSRAQFRAELQSSNFSPIKLDVPEESPELPALTFSPISLDTSTHTTPGTTYHFPSPSEMAPIPRFSSPTDMAPSMTARFPSPSQIGQSIEAFRPTPLTANEIAEIGTSISRFRPSPLSAVDIAELSNSPIAVRPTHLSEARRSEYPFHSPPQPTGGQSEATEYPFQSPPLGTSGSEQPGLTPMRTPSLSRARELIRRHSSFKTKTPELPSLPPLPNPKTLPSPTPPPLKFKKRSADRPELPAVSTKAYTPPKKPTRAKDLPFNYISLPSPQSPSSPSAIQAPTSAMDAIARTGSATTTYSIPIGLARSHKRKDTAKSAETLTVADQDVLLTHNHSREWSESDREHVMSWATYNGPDSPLMEGGEDFSPMVEHVARIQKVERFRNPKLLGRRSPQQELRQDSGVAGMEGQEGTGKSELKRTSRTSMKEKRNSPKSEKKRDSSKSAKMSSPGSEVSPLFSPIPAGYKFSPLSPEERVWAGQE